MIIKDWRIEEKIGYKPMTTYYTDFSIADNFGIEAIKDTYKKNFKQAKELGYKYITEFVLALNWKIWEHYGFNENFAELYNTLWEEANNYTCENLTKKELSYFFATTD